MHTTILLVRNATTDWNRLSRIVGRREIGLSTEGIAQAEALAARLAKLEIAEIISSPLVRALETAERLAAPHKIEVARDPRLTDLHAGRWEGMGYAEVQATDEYRRFVANPLEATPPGMEQLSNACDRLTGSIDQALTDNELGASILVVSHAGPLRLLVARYLGLGLGEFHRLRVSPASVTVLRFTSIQGAPRLLSLNASDDFLQLLA